MTLHIFPLLSLKMLPDFFLHTYGGKRSNQWGGRAVLDRQALKFFLLQCFYFFSDIIVLCYSFLFSFVYSLSPCLSVSLALCHYLLLSLSTQLSLPLFFIIFSISCSMSLLDFLCECLSKGSVSQYNFQHLSLSLTAHTHTLYISHQ